MIVVRTADGRVCVRWWLLLLTHSLLCSAPRGWEAVKGEYQVCRGCQPQPHCSNQFLLGPSLLLNMSPGLVLLWTKVLWRCQQNFAEFREISLARLIVCSPVSQLLPRCDPRLVMELWSDDLVTRDTWHVTAGCCAVWRGCWSCQPFVSRAHVRDTRQQITWHLIVQQIS